MTIPIDSIEPEKTKTKKAIKRPIFKDYFKLTKDAWVLEKEDDSFWYFKRK